jgi:hypothetical protein
MFRGVAFPFESGGKVTDMAKRTLVPGAEASSAQRAFHCCRTSHGQPTALPQWTAQREKGHAKLTQRFAAPAVGEGQVVLCFATGAQVAFRLNGTPLLHFSATLNDATWRSTDGRAALRHFVRENAGEGSYFVLGQLRSYKIHLGSGHILMTPNDQYLCIVPKQAMESSEDKVFLPFEGEGRLSVILSKALPLAEDDRIRDPSLVSQLKR